MICLSEIYQGTVTFVSQSTSETAQPVANLGSSNLGLTWQNTTAVGPTGATWHYSGAEVSAWAFVVAALNDAGAAAGRNMRLNTDDVSPYSGASPTLQTGNSYNYSLVTQYGLAGTPDQERTDFGIYLGVDTLQSGGPSVTGVPTAFAHNSGIFQWVHAGGDHPDGYHRAAGFVIGINPLIFPYPKNVEYREIELRKGSGWEVTLSWDFMPEHNHTTGSQTYRGGNELLNLVTRQRRRPIMALLDTSGFDDNGVPNNSQASPWGRLGVARIVDFSPSSFTSSADYAVSSRNFSPTIKLRTWEQEGQR